jgi:transposase
VAKKSVGRCSAREGLYSSYLTAWRRERDEGELAGLTPKKRGRKETKNPLADENVRPSGARTGSDETS